MARYTFGGDIHDLIARPDANAGGALKPAPGATIQFFAAATGGTVITDYLVDSNGDGSFETSDTSVVVRSTGYLPDFQGPDGVDVLYYDPDPTDADVRRVRYVARDSGTGGIPTASTSAAGIVEYADATELATGTATNRVTSVADVTSKLNTHINATNPHSVYGDAIDDINAALLTKPTLNSEGVLTLDDLPVSTTGSPGTLVGYRSDGSAGGVSSTAADAYLPRAAIETLINTNLVAGGDVRGLAYAPGTPLSSTSSTTFTTVPTAVVTDAASGQRWRCEYDIIYRATAASGIQVRHKTGVATVTNLLTNPSFETDATGWSGNAAAGTPVRNTSQGGQDGTANLQVSTVGTAVTPLVFSQWFPYTPGTHMSVGGYAKRSSATARTCRVDIQYGTSAAVDYDASTGVLFADNGNGVSSTTAYQQSKYENSWSDNVAAAKVRARLAVQASSAGDVHHFDAIQLEPGTTLPAYGSTGGSGSGALTFTGRWGPGLTVAAASADNYSKVTTLRAASNTLTTHGGLGASTDAFLYGSFEATIGGTNLINQRIELEIARIAGTDTTQIMSVNATFARIA